jgi:hypothetical protein
MLVRSARFPRLSDVRYFGGWISEPFGFQPRATANRHAPRTNVPADQKKSSDQSLLPAIVTNFSPLCRPCIPIKNVPALQASINRDSSRACVRRERLENQPGFELGVCGLLLGGISRSIARVGSDFLLHRDLQAAHIVQGYSNSLRRCNTFSAVRGSSWIRTVAACSALSKECGLQ